MLLLSTSYTVLLLVWVQDTIGMNLAHETGRLSRQVYLPLNGWLSWTRLLDDTFTSTWLYTNRKYGPETVKTGIQQDHILTVVNQVYGAKHRKLRRKPGLRRNSDRKVQLSSGRNSERRQYLALERNARFLGSTAQVVRSQIYQSAG